MTWLLISIGFLSVLWFLYRWRRDAQYRLPPGPKGVPVLGNLLDMEPMFHLTCAKLEKLYGKIYSLQLGKFRTVIVHDLNVLKEIMSQNAFSGRPDTIGVHVLAQAQIGIISSFGQHWNEQRRFTIRHLRDFGFGRKGMEDLISEEVAEFLDALEAKEGKPFNIDRMFGVAVLNSLWRIVTGKRYAHSDPRLHHFLEEQARTFNALFTNGIIIFLPWLISLFPVKSGWKRIQEFVGHLHDFFQEAIDEHNVQGDKNNEEDADFIDAYLSEIRRTTDPSSSFFGDSGKKALIAVMGDLFSGGSETTSMTLNWAIRYLITNPDVQEKMSAEIVRVVGSDRLPGLTDRPRMPYTQAVIAETLRRSSVVPITLFHNTLEPVSLDGDKYHLPKDTIVLGAIWCIHHDPDLWPDPFTFNPDRFLARDEGELLKFVKNDNLVSFSVGKRACLGESLGRDELFLFLTALTQKYRLLKNPDTPEVDLESDVTSLLSPKPYDILISKR